MAHFYGGMWPMEGQDGVVRCDTLLILLIFFVLVQKRDFG